MPDDAKATSTAPAGGTSGSDAGKGGGGQSDAGASAAAASASQAQQRNWEKDYGDLERQHNEYRSRYGGYDEIVGDDGKPLSPAALKAMRQWVAERVAELRAGKLGYLPEKGKETASSDPFGDDYDDLPRREQFKREQKLLLEEIRNGLKPDLDAIRGETAGTRDNLNQQLQMMLHLVKLARQYPDLNPDDLVKGATETSTRGPLEFLDLQAQLMRQPKEIETKIAAALEKAKAEWKQEQDKARVPNATRATARLVSNLSKDKDAKTADKGQRRLKILGNFRDRVAKSFDATGSD